ncbi:hypothetical protein [Helicobacter rodentium]|uniref:hypothetical protein n=1 Tax=Helicobacter rodentium TaxID=59617 RepID=UPI0023F17A11|nr:hypothetical protein [Helicobacter rodentium]
MLNYLNDSIVIFALCLIMDCHDSAKAESRNDRVESFRSARLWICKCGSVAFATDASLCSQ